MGEINLQTLLKNMQPLLQDGIFVFHSSNISFEDAAKLNPTMLFRENEGTSLILRKEYADQAGLEYIYPSNMITLNVHSSLDAVGFMAAITNKLATNDISVNLVSAHFHDHLFVPENTGNKVIQILNELAQS